MQSIKEEEEDELEQSTSEEGDAYVDEEYALSGILEPGNPARWACSALLDDLESGQIDLNAEYQREVVWDEKKQSALIDSIFRHYYIPPILFAVVYERNGEEKRVCMDGKQRLTAIRRFMSGEIPYIDPDSKDKLWMKTQGGKATKKRRKMLPPALIRVFERRQLLCMEFTKLTGAQEREIFQRVQKGMPLTVAERQQAIDSPYRPWIGQLQSTYVDDAIHKHYIELKLNRTRGYQLIVETIAAILKGLIPSIPTYTSTSLEKWLYDNQDAIDEGMKKTVTETYHIFSNTAEKYGRETYTDPPRIAPIEFMYTIYLIHLHKRSLNEIQLAKAIKDMRRTVRAEHKDIRLNNAVRKTLGNFVSEKLPLMIDAGEYNLHSGGGTKRKAVAMADGDNDEDVEMVDERPPPKKRNVVSFPSSLSPRKPALTVAPIKPRATGKP